MAKKSKSFFKMTPAERDADVARYDQGVDFERTAPLSAPQRARWERAKSGTSPMQAVNEEARVLISVNPKLLAKAHARARREGKTFSAWVSELLRAAERRAG